MEEDRALTDLGIAADIEEAQNYEAQSSHADEHLPPPSASTSQSASTSTSTPDDEPAPSPGPENAVRQPKKRFVGRRAAAEGAAAKREGASNGADGRAVQGLSSTSSTSSTSPSAPPQLPLDFSSDHMMYISRKTSQGTSPIKSGPQGDPGGS